MDWLHFIGKNYYPSPNVFIREAQKYGVSRRISPFVFKRFNIGDRVFLFQWDKKKKASILFGYFKVERIYGKFSKLFNKEVQKKSKVDKEVEDLKQKIIEDFVKRECGEFDILEYIAINLAIEEINNLLENFGCKHLMIGGKFVKLKETQSHIIFQRGFRHFDYNTYKLHKQQGKRSTSQFYEYPYPPKIVPDENKALIINIDNYRKASEIH